MENLATSLRQQESLREIVESISSELELRPLLALILRHACDLLGAQHGAIGLLDEQRSLVRTEAAYNMPASELGAECPPNVGLFGQVLASHTRIILDRYSELHQPAQFDFLDNAVIGVPIVWRDEIIGVFGLASPPPRRFTSQDAEALTLFAHHAAIAVVIARLLALQKERTTRSLLITEIGNQINRSLELEQILQAAVEAINRHFREANIALLLVDPEDASMLVLRAMSSLCEAVAPEGYRQSISIGIMGASARTQQPVLVAGPQRELPYTSWESFAPGVDGIQAELAIPLLINRRLLGVLDIQSRQPIGPENLAELSLIAEQLSSAINNAHHYEEEKKRTERLELIARVGQRIAARLNQDELFTTTIDELHSQLGYDHVALFLVDPVAPGSPTPDEAGWLVLRARASRWLQGPAIGWRQPIQEGILGMAARQRTPVLVNDVRQRPAGRQPVAGVNRRVALAAHSLSFAPGRSMPSPHEAAPLSTEMRAELAAPIFSGERLLGVLYIAGRRQFLDEDVKAVQIIADQLAVAIEHTYFFADTQRAFNETALLYQTSQRISVALDVDEVVETYLAQVAARGRYACSVALYEFDTAGERVAVVVRGRWTPAEGLNCPMRERLPYTRDQLDALLDEGQTVTISNVYTDPRVSDELRNIQRRDNRPALAMIPLMMRGRRIGLVILSYPTIHEWQPAHLHSYQITAAQLAAAVESRLQQELLAKHDQQLAVLEERRRLARELHDSVTQLLFSITLIAQSLGPAWRRNPAEGEQRIQRLLELSQAALAEMRALLVELRPPEQLSLSIPDEGLDDTRPLTSLGRVQQHGLEAALGAHISNLAADGLLIDLDTSAYVSQTVEYEETLFRLVQESLNNVLKHAKATHVQVHLAVQDGAVYLAVCDDGVGFREHSGQVLETASAARERGMGLRTMRERAAALGGACRIKSTPGKGTTVEVVIPGAQSSLSDATRL